MGQRQVHRRLPPTPRDERVNVGRRRVVSVALAGNTLALLQNAMVLFNVPLPRVIENGLWNTARISSRFGDVWNVRMVLLLVLAGLLALAIYWRDEKPRAVAPFWEALMWGTALVIGTFAVSSHASGSLMMPWVAMSMHWLHATAVAVWVGGLAALALILPRALAPYTGEDRRLALLAAMRRFSPLAVGYAADYRDHWHLQRAQLAVYAGIRR